MTTPRLPESSTAAPRRRPGSITLSLVGFLFLVELASGILQGYYVPLISDIVTHLGIHDADFNWFEAGQLLLSAATVPLLAKLGDMLGHKRMLLISMLMPLILKSALWQVGNLMKHWKNPRKFFLSLSKKRKPLPSN